MSAAAKAIRSCASGVSGSRSFRFAVRYGWVRTNAAQQRSVCWHDTSRMQNQQRLSARQCWYSWTRCAYSSRTSLTVSASMYRLRIAS